MMTLIKRIFNPGNYPDNISLALMILRLVAGILMLTHGYGKFLILTGDGPVQFADPLGVGETTTLVLAVFAELFCSVFLILGVATRFCAIPLLITMLVAALIIHSSDPLSRKELPLLYAAIFLVIAITGAGKYSLDNWIFKK